MRATNVFIPELPFNPEQGKELAQMGMQLALDNAEAKNEGWKNEALIFLQQFISITTKPFMCEDFRDYATKKGLAVPPCLRAYGALMRQGAKRGWIKQIGYGKVKNPIARQANAAIWQKVI